MVSSILHRSSIRHADVILVDNSIQNGTGIVQGAGVSPALGRFNEVDIFYAHTMTGGVSLTEAWEFTAGSDVLWDGTNRMLLNG